MEEKVNIIGAIVNNAILDDIIKLTEDALNYEINSYMPHNGTIEKLQKLKQYVELKKQGK